MNRILAPALAALLIVATVPASAASREQLQMMAEIRMLQEQNQQLQLALRTLTDALRAITTTIDEQAGVNRKAFADSKMIVDNVAGDIRIVREKIDDTNVRISTLSQEVEALRNAVPVAPPPLVYMPPAVSEQPTDPSAGAFPSPVPPPAAGSAVPPGMAPQRMWDSAYSDYTAGQWSLAIAGFEGYVRTFPRSEQADDAQYYIGESYYADGKFKEALNAYEQVIRDYARGNMVPEATYKKGLTLGRLGRNEEARAAYQALVQNYPETNAGRLAKQRIDEISRTRPR